ncbi:MAG: error-prone DNA polymerase, partial [Candidatus Saccharibacteria bacterium]
GGLVVCREPLQNITPLQMAAKGMVITQFDKDDVEDLGLVKLDLLSLRTLGAVDDAVIRIHNNGKSLNYDEIPLNDAETYQMLNTGDTIGVFQLESPAQRALQARLGASHMEDIVASVAIIRPGPIKGNMVEPYIARRHGQEPVTFMHPKLEPILRKTYGVVLFQEQVIEIATAVANFTPGEADNLRRVMTHSRSMKTMEEIGRTFVERSVQNGVSQEDAERIFACMLGYASYGFCEAHAAAFGTTAFKTAYLLQHFPAEFYAAILSNQPMGYYPPHIICNEARRRGIKMLPPRVNNSAEKFKVEGNAIRVPLVQIKGLSRPGVKDMLGNQPFTSFADLVIRTDLNRDEIETLIKCGATDEMDANRRRLLAQVPGCLESRRASREGKAELFVAEPAGAFEIPDLTEEEKHYWEFELLGLDVREHVMTRFRKSLMAQRCRTSRELRSVKDQSWVRTAGLLLSPHRPPTKSGKIVVFMSLEDEFGLTDVTVFEDVYQQYGHLIFAPQTGPLLVEGILQKRGNGISIVARKIEQVIQVI